MMVLFDPLPPLCVPKVDIDVHMIKLTRSSSPLPFLHSVSNRNLDGGKAWEQGYALQSLNLLYSPRK